MFHCIYINFVCYVTYYHLRIRTLQTYHEEYLCNINLNTNYENLMMLFFIFYLVK